MDVVVHFLHCALGDAVLATLHDHDLLENLLTLVTIFDYLYCFSKDPPHVFDLRWVCSLDLLARLLEGLDLLLVNEEEMHQLVTLDLILQLKMSIKHHFNYLCDVVLDEVYSQCDHCLLSLHVLDVEDATLSLETSSENLPAFFGDRHSARVNL